MPIDANDSPMTDVGSIRPVRPDDFFDEAALQRGADSLSRGAMAVSGMVAARNASKINDLRDGEYVSDLMANDAEMLARPVDNPDMSADEYDKLMIEERREFADKRANELLDGMGLSGKRREKALESFRQVSLGRSEGAFRQKMYSRVLDEQSAHHENRSNSLVANFRYLDAIDSYSEEMAPHLSPATRDANIHRVAGLAAQHIAESARAGIMPNPNAVEAMELMSEDQRVVAERGLLVLRVTSDNPQAQAELKSASDLYVESMSGLYEDGLTVDEATSARSDIVNTVNGHVDSMVFIGPSAAVDREQYRAAKMDEIDERLVDHIRFKLSLTKDLRSAMVAIESLNLDSDKKDAAVHSLNNIQKGLTTEQDKQVLKTDVESRYIEIIEGVADGSMNLADVDVHQFDSREDLTDAAKNQAVLRLMMARESAMNRKKARLDISQVRGDHAAAHAMRDGNKTAWDAELELHYNSILKESAGNPDVAMARVIADYGMLPPNVAALWKNLGMSNKDEQIASAIPMMASVLKGQNAMVLEEAGIPKNIIRAADEWALSGNMENAVSSVRGGAESVQRIDFDSSESKVNLAKQALGGLGVDEDAIKLLVEEPAFEQYFLSVQDRILGDGRNLSVGAVVDEMRSDTQEGNFPLSFSQAGGFGGESVWMRGQSPEQSVQRYAIEMGVDSDLMNDALYGQIGRSVAESDIVSSMRKNNELSQDAIDMLNDKDFAGFAREFLTLEHTGNGYDEETLKKLEKPNSLAFHKKHMGNVSMPNYHVRIIDAAGTPRIVTEGDNRLHLDPTDLPGWVSESSRRAPQDVRGYYSEVYKGMVRSSALDVVSQTGFNGRSFPDMAAAANAGDKGAKKSLATAASVSMLLGNVVNTSGQNVEFAKFGDISIPVQASIARDDKRYDKLVKAIDWLIENEEGTRLNNGIPSTTIDRHRGALSAFENDTSIWRDSLRVMGYGDNELIIDILFKGVRSSPGQVGAHRQETED